MSIDLRLGDCLEILPTLPDNSVDCVITDPPYGLVSIQKRFGKEGSAPAQFGKDGSFARLSGGFMGKKWDGSGIEYNVDMWTEILRVLKPGGYLLSFGGTRTYHRMTTAIEDAGFEIRDMIEWVYGSGFPKSHNIGKAVDKLQGNEREDLGKYIPPDGKKRNLEKHKPHKEASVADHQYGYTTSGFINQTKGTSEWEGWGTALKPAHEPICMARKPLSEKTVAENVLKWGVGGLNIDISRVEHNEECKMMKPSQANIEHPSEKCMQAGRRTEVLELKPNGRFPANLIHDNSEEVRECFPEARGSKPYKKLTNYNFDVAGEHKGQKHESQAGLGETGNASRFFKSIIYQSKASKAERGEGNSHPTVKPIALMEYLIKMVSREGVIILDPFMGSGTTGVACVQTGRNFIGIELEPKYFEIAEKRIAEAQLQMRMEI